MFGLAMDRLPPLGWRLGATASACRGLGLMICRMEVRMPGIDGMSRMHVPLLFDNAWWFQVGNGVVVRLVHPLLPRSCALARCIWDCMCGQQFAKRIVVAEHEPLLVVISWLVRGRDDTLMSKPGSWICEGHGSPMHAADSAAYACELRDGVPCYNRTERLLTTATPRVKQA